MNPRLLAFQNKYVKKLVRRAIDHLSEDGSKIMLLEAPTGSGKTVMASEFAQQLSDKIGGLAFVWLAPNKLHEQSLRNMQAASSFLPSLVFVSPDELGYSLGQGDVLFLNWASVDKKENVLRKQRGEEGITLCDLLEATREEGKRIILIIDESHVHVGADAAQGVINEIIKPDLTLEVSATPSINRYDSRITINRDEVIKEGLIRKEIVINPGMGSKINVIPTDDQVSLSGGAGYMTVLSAAIEHRARLTKVYSEKNIAVNPLVIIQFPDSSAGDFLMGAIEDYLSKKKISTANGKLAIWLSEEHINLDNITDSCSKQEVLFFKNAVALGWDCPRAQILVALRELKSNAFTSQILGRILRQPLHKHFDLNLLDRGYVFTNVDSFKITKDLDGVLPSREVRSTAAVKFNISNWIQTRAKNGHLALRSIQDSIDATAATFIEQSSLKYQGRLTGAMVTDIIIDDLDKSFEQLGSATYALGLAQLETLFTSYISTATNEFQNSGAARRFVRKGLERLATNILGIDTDISIVENSSVRQRALETILHPNNLSQIDEMLKSILDAFKSDDVVKDRTLERCNEWTPPTTITVLASTRDKWTKSLYACYPKEFTDIENKLAMKFENDPDVQVWVKNGDNGKDWFSIDYEMNGNKKLFYPDFLVLYKNNKIGIYEGKGNSTNGTAAGEETKLKAQRLQQFLSEEKKNGLDVEGYIAVLKGNQIFINDSQNYTYTNELQGWRKIDGHVKE